MKAIILYPDPRGIGGVVNFIETLRQHFSPGCVSEQYQIGRRLGRRLKFPALLVPLHDALGLSKAIRRLRPDVIHVNPSFNLASVLRDGLFMLTLRALGRRSVFVFWHGWQDGLARRIGKNPLLRAAFRAAFGYAAHTVVLAGQFRDQLVEMGFPPERVSIESTMFDGEQFNGISRRAHDGITLLFLSRMEPAKGGVELIEAFARLKGKYPDARLIMAGEGSVRKMLEARVRGLGIADVSFTGYLRGTDKAQTIIDADVFILPSYSEGCPVSLLEAMAAGLPCITNSVGGIPDIFRDGLNGVLLDGVSVDSVTRALDDLLGDPARRAAIGECNRKEAWERYEAGVVTQRIEAIYRSVAELDAAH